MLGSVPRTLAEYGPPYLVVTNTSVAPVRRCALVSTRSALITTPEPQAVSPFVLMAWSVRTVTTLGPTLSATRSADRVVDRRIRCGDDGRGDRGAVPAPQGAECHQEQEGGGDPGAGRQHADDPFAGAGRRRRDLGRRDERLELGGVDPGAVEGVGPGGDGRVVVARVVARIVVVEARHRAECTDAHFA